MKNLTKWDIFWILALSSQSAFLVWWITDIFNLLPLKMFLFNTVGWVLVSLVIGLVDNFKAWDKKTYGNGTTH